MQFFASPASANSDSVVDIDVYCLVTSKVIGHASLRAGENADADGS